MMIYIWLILVVGFAVVEAITLTLSSIWFAFGALAAMIAATVGLSTWPQVIIFLIVSAVLLFFTKPLFKRYLSIKNERTNADRILDQTALVIETIDNINEKGQIKLKGQVWSARSHNNEIIEKGENVRVLRITGVRAYVEKI